MYQVKIVRTEDVIELRHKVLRPNQERKDCYYPGDDDESTMHFATVNENQEIHGIATIYLENSDLFSDEIQYRLRGMATSPESRGKGLGVMLVKEIIKTKKQNTIWCNARTSALGFYEKLGFEIFGEEFVIDPIGPHFVMAINTR